MRAGAAPGPSSPRPATSSPAPPCAAVFIENRDRRSELAAYVAPRALHAAWQRLEAHGWVRSVPGAHVAVFSAACGMLLYCYEAARQEAATAAGGDGGGGAAVVNPWRTPAAAAVLGEPVATVPAPEAAGALRLGFGALEVAPTGLTDLPAATTPGTTAHGRDGGSGGGVGSCESPAVRRAASSKAQLPVAGDCGGTGSAHSSPPLPEFEDGSRGGLASSAGVAGSFADDEESDDRLTADPAEASFVATPGGRQAPLPTEKLSDGNSSRSGSSARRRRYHLLPFSPFREWGLVTLPHFAFVCVCCTAAGTYCVVIPPLLSPRYP